MARKTMKTTGVRKALLSQYIPSALIEPQRSRKINAPSTTATIEKIIAGEPVGQVCDMRVDKPKTQKAKKTRPLKTKLRSTITPGTILILVAGKYRGKRVVFLKQLESGLLLVTGPAKLNRVPLYRIGQSFVIATSTKIDISQIPLSDLITDDLFKAKPKSSEELIQDPDAVAEKPKIHPVLAEEQRVIDPMITSIVKEVPMLAAYLSSMFTLSKGEAPHALKF